MGEQNRAFLVRLRPTTYELLDKAAADQRRSKASLIDALIREHLQPRYSDVRDRLDQLLAGRR
jgi:hypothetical protein